MILARAVALLLLFAVAAWSPAKTMAQLSFELQPIHYSDSVARDPVARLKQQLESGEVSFNQQGRTELLSSLLQELEIPASSQTLVYSKTSLQRHLISAANPRAIYFNDDTYIGWIPNGEMIEIASTDPRLGTVFYVIEISEREQQIVRRNDRCLFCHASTDTGRVPGLLMQSVYTDSSGNRTFPEQAIEAKAKGPIVGRWAGWFATGKHGRQLHLANKMIQSNSKVQLDNIGEPSNVVDLSRWFEVSKYLTPHSDIVALLVLQHQVTMHNLLTSVNHRALRRLYDEQAATHQFDADKSPQSKETRTFLNLLAKELVDGMLMVDDVEFADRITGSSSFANDFSARGPRDSVGRSLRQLDLHKRLFRYRCSYLIYTESFNSLPQPLLSRVYKRLWDVLRSPVKDNEYAHISVDERTAIMQILRATKPDLPAFWSQDHK